MTPLNQSSNKRPLFQGILIVLLVFLAYVPAFRGQFVWDDDINVINNQTLRTPDGLRRIWFEPGATQQYYPLTHTSFWLDYHLWGMNTIGYHALNICLQAFSALLLWRILKRLDVPGAWLGAALFALHPVCVESVAWITERKNSLCGVFFLGSIFASIGFWLPIRAASTSRAEPADSSSGNGRWMFYWLALFFYLCALCAKTAAVGLPAVIVLLWWWKRTPFRLRNAFLLLPFLAIGMVMGLVTMWVEKNHVGAAGQEWHFSWLERCQIAGRAWWFYLGKLLCPYPLDFMYPRWVIQASQPLAYLPPAAAVIGILILWRERNGWARPVLFTAGYFAALLFPVLGFFDVFFFRYSFVCDHFQYLACMAPLALAGAGIATFVNSLKKWNQVLFPVVCSVLLLALGVLTWRQSRMYRNLETLWRETLAHNEHSWMAHNNLGNILAGKGNLEEAVQHYKNVLRENAGFAPAHSNLGAVLFEQGKVDEAIVQLIEALRLNPHSGDAHFNLGLALEAKGDLEGASREYNEVLQLMPGYAPANNNLGQILARQGKMDEAISYYTLALQSDPNYAAVYDNLGFALASKGNLDDAISHYLHALQSDPNLAEAHHHLGLAYNAKGDLDNALLQYNAAVQLKPGMAEAHYDLGVLLARRGELAQARAQFTEALRLKPDYAEASKQLQALPR